jgi:hypothetical protein
VKRTDRDEVGAGASRARADRYRKVPQKLWGDERFCALTRAQPSGQGLYLYLITGPHTGPIPGLFKAGRAALAEDLGWEIEAFDEAFAEVLRQGLAKADFKAKVVWLPDAISVNRPESPNVVRSWAGEFDLIPECDLKREAYQALRASIHAVGEAFGKAFDEAIRKPSPKPSPMPSLKAMANQEQEQEQEYSEAKASAAAAASATHAVAGMVQAMSAGDRIWTLGPAVLGESGRGHLGRLRKLHGDEVVAEALEACALERPSDPKSWLVAACQARADRQQKSAGTGVDLGDPKPAWAVAAGFSSRFEAENEGCYEHNAAQFSGGRRKVPA